jgi:hypothetical protein
MQWARAILPSVPCPALQYFSTLSHKRQDFRIKILLNIKCGLRVSPQLLSETFLILRRTERDIAKNVCLHIKYRYSCQIFMKLEFSRHVFEKYSNIKFRENPSSVNRIVQCGRTDRETDMTKLIMAFRNLTRRLTKICANRKTMK